MISSLSRFGGVNLLPVALALLALVLIGSPSSWVTLTAAGLAMGMMIFLMASGLSLIFGLMDVLNFGHSAFVSFGAFVAASVLAALGGWVTGGSPALNLLALLAAIGAATAFGAVAGWFFDLNPALPYLAGAALTLLAAWLVSGVRVADERSAVEARRSG